LGDFGLKVKRGWNEDQLYDAILTAIEEQCETASDITTWESLSYVELTRMLKENREPAENAVRNSLLLLLALCPSHHDGIDLRGEDVSNLSPRERTQVLAKLKAAFF